MKFTIYTPRFNERGGVIALYNLCRLLNEAGYPSAIWTSDRKIHGSIRNTAGNIYRTTQLACVRSFRYPLYSNILNQPTASHKFLKNSVVVYPEIINGNPLNSQKVVRWILGAPGEEFMNKFSLNDGNIFYYRDKFIDNNSLNIERRHLQTPYFPLQILTPANHPRKRKFCFIRHKFRNASLIDLGDDAVCLDGLNVKQIVKIFKETEKFVSYDSETGYTRLAILCGTIPIVVPKFNVSKTIWRPCEKERLGIAYGFNESEIEWASQTRDLAITEIIERCEEAKIHASQFAKEVLKLFS